MGSDSTRSAAGVRVRAVILVGASFVALIAVAALQGVPAFREVTFAGPTAQPTGAPQSMPPQETMPPLEPTETNPWVTIIAAVIGSAVALLLAFLLIRAIVRALRRWWQDRPLERAEGVAPDTGLLAMAEPEDSVAAEVVRHGIAGALDAVGAHAAPSDAITAAWVGLEESAEQAGVRRGIAETPAEFTVRIVGTREQSAPEVRSLLALYENVRFGGRVATEDDRARARVLLQSIQEHWR